MQNEIFDITIIGAGPVGLFTGFYAGLRQAKFKIIDSLEEVGGQPKYLYPEKNIYDIPAFPKIKGDQLADQLMQQLARFDYSLCLGQEIVSIEKTADYFTLKSQKENHYSKTIIIAAGNGAFSPKRLSIKEAENYESGNLSYYVKPLDYYQDKNIVICGGGDSAVDWALELESIAKKVSIVHRRDKFRAMEASVQALKNSKVDIFTPYVPYQIIGQGNQIQQLVIKEARGDNQQILDLDELIVNYGFSSSIGTIRQWGLDIERNSIVVNQLLETNQAGVFAVGDIAQYPGKVDLIATGFGEAPMAVNQALLHIDPHNIQPPIHSSDIF